MRMLFATPVPSDLSEILEYIAKDSPRHAVRIVGLLRARCREIAKNPEVYQVRPEIGEGARLVAVGSYVILFRVRDGVVWIERILHGNRDLSGLLDY